VNHRHLSLQLKLPIEVQRYEAELRERLRERVERGHVTVAARWLEEPSRPAGTQLDLHRARE